ncbi:hypothetical protein Tco_0721716 [Tanacetum coccineum]
MIAITALTKQVEDLVHHISSMQEAYNQNQEAPIQLMQTQMGQLEEAFQERPHVCAIRSSTSPVQRLCVNYFDYEGESSGSTTTRSDYSLPDYDAFYFDDNHFEEKSSGSTTTHFDFSLPEYASFHFDLLIDPLPPADRSDSHHEEFVDELTHITSTVV